MATNSEVRGAVLNRLGISQQALSQRAQTLKRRTPMTTEDAVYVIAHDIGIDVGRYLDNETLARVRGIVERMAPKEVHTRRVPAARSERLVQIAISASVSASLPVLSSARAREAKRMAERVYPLLYVFENSARDLIHGVLSAQIGRDWWEVVAPPRLKSKVADRRVSEGREAWHGARGAHSVFYLDLADLPALVNQQSSWMHFKQIFPRPHWFDGVVDDMNVSRRVVAHMNPLADDDMRLVAAGFAKWHKLMLARRPEIAALLEPVTS